MCLYLSSAIKIETYLKKRNHILLFIFGLHQTKAIEKRMKKKIKEKDQKY